MSSAQAWRLGTAALLLFGIGAALLLTRSGELRAIDGPAPHRADPPAEAPATDEPTPVEIPAERTSATRAMSPGRSRPRPPSGAWPPGDSALPIERCGVLGNAGRDLETGVIGSIPLRCDPPLWISLVRKGDTPRIPRKGTLDRPVPGRVLESQILQPGVEEVVFIVDAGSILAQRCSLRLRVVDAVSREPIEGANVELYMNGALLFDSSGPGGVFVMEKVVDPGPRQVRISSKGYDRAVRDVDLAPGSDVDLGDIPLDALARGALRVSVRGPEGLSGAIVHCLPLEWLRSGDEPLALDLWTKALGDENATEVQLVAGSWGVWVEGTSSGRNLRSLTKSFEIAEGSTTAAFDLVPTVPVSLHSSTKCSVSVRDLDGLWMHRLVIVPPKGGKRIELVPGPYELVVQVSGREDRVLPLRVGAEETAIDLD